MQNVRGLERCQGYVLQIEAYLLEHIADIWCVQIVKGGREMLYVEKPFGYSFFPKELAPTPKSWAATSGNLVHYGQHKSGGHFAVSLHITSLLVCSVLTHHRLWRSQKSYWQMLRSG